MANPRSLIRALDKHWDIIEQLVLKSKEQLTWEINTLSLLLEQIYFNESFNQHQDRLQQLINADILRVLPRSSEFELNGTVLDFVSQLLNEHELSSPTLITAHISDIKVALQDLQEALQNKDMEKLRRGVSRINKKINEISKRMEGDKHAIADIAEWAKTADSQMPLSRRYQEVLETYDRYILPMTELMDTGASGLFYPLLEKTESVLDNLSEQLAIQGALISHQLNLRYLNFTIKDLRRNGRETLNYCTHTLMPLREEYRRHNQLSTAVAKLLGEVRKRGLKHTFSGSALPLWRREQSRRITVDESLLAFWAAARGYTPQIVAFPEIIEDSQSLKQEWLDEQAIEQQLINSLPIADLMQWLLENYSEYQDVTLIKLYHRLSRLPMIKAINQDHITRRELKHHAIQLYSYQLSLYEHQS